MPKRFTKTEAEYVVAQYAKQGPAAVAKTLHRTISSIHHIASRMNVGINRPRKHWNADDSAYLKQHYFDKGSHFVAKALGRSHVSILHRASRMGIACSDLLARLRQKETLAKRFDEHRQRNGFKDSHAWKRFVLKRDNYICADCGLRDPVIAVAHHIIRRTIAPGMALGVDNGITLCPNCHAKRHVTEGRGSGNRLTKRDKELIIELRAFGRSCKQIANDIGINHKTVRRRLSLIR